MGGGVPNLVGKMRVKIVDRKVYIPKGVIEKTRLPERGECELVVEGDELRIRAPVPEDPAFLRVLGRRPVRRPISEMITSRWPGSTKPKSSVVPVYTDGKGSRSNQARRRCSEPG